MGLSGFELFIILLVVVLLFGSGKISGLLGDLAQGLKTFKRTMSEPDAKPPAASSPAQLPRKRKRRDSKPTLEPR